MRKYLISAAAIMVASPSIANIIEDAHQVLEMWAPTEIAFSDGTLSVTLPQRQITSEIYLAVIQTGICLAPFFEIDLQEVKQIEVLNQFSAQGYVYEKGMDDCEVFNNLPANDKSIEFQILGYTHAFSN